MPLRPWRRKFSECVVSTRAQSTDGSLSGLTRRRAARQGRPPTGLSKCGEGWVEMHQLGCVSVASGGVASDGVARGGGARGGVARGGWLRADPRVFSFVNVVIDCVVISAGSVFRRRSVCLVRRASGLKSTL